MIKQIMLHHNFIKLASCIIGYTTWAFIAQHQHITVNQPVSLCFYQTNDLYQIKAPESVVAVISGKRQDIHRYNPEQNAFHIDASTYKEGTHQVTLLNENLFLPDNLKMVQLIPSSITVTISKQV